MGRLPLAAHWTRLAMASSLVPGVRTGRCVRGSAVIYRKLSLGSQSEGGERRIERLLSAHTTCRLQCRSLFAYLADAITAHTRGRSSAPTHLSSHQPNAYRVLGLISERLKIVVFSVRFRVSPTAPPYAMAGCAISRAHISDASM